MLTEILERSKNCFTATRVRGVARYAQIFPVHSLCCEVLC